MRRFMVFLAGACAILAGRPVFAEPREMIGKQAPGFTGAQPLGAPVSLEQIRGKVPLILTFWSIYCKTCVEEMTGLQKLYEKHGPEKVAVVAINEDGDVGVERVKGFLDKAAASPGGKFTFPILFDGKGEVFRAYGVSRLPTLFFVEPGGTVKSAIEGFEPGKELAVMSAIEKLLGTVSLEALEEVAAEAVFELNASVPLCGTYRDGKWYRPLDLEETRQDVVARARAEGEEYLRKEAVRVALQQLGVSLHDGSVPPTCQAPYGVELHSISRKKDPLSLFVERLNLPRVLAVDSQETVEQEREIGMYRRIKVFLPALREQLARDGYSLKPSELRLRFARASHFEEHTLVEALSTQLQFLSSIRRITPHVRGRAEYLVVAHAAPEKVVEAMRGLDVGGRRLSVELMQGGILEVSMWR